ncbi:hypothetical protein [Roseibium sp. RKSG952]|uniref:hypothetical protein n=1 Tax=Roseibium sp. RKSG952 TaxID=2529384 RepID=UPI0012BCD691|nr:hypothetical protein [Roseibium sp. RKSG952]MTH96075.1 hypothetical protein [Roseibium sp. RKSG952]
MTGWKTAAVNGGVVTAVVLAEIVGQFAALDWREFLPDGMAGVVIAGLGAANLVLRHVTRGPAGWRR